MTVLIITTAMCVYMIRRERLTYLAVKRKLDQYD